MEPPPLDPHGKPSGGPVNRRAEMWMKSREWLEDPAGVQIPDMDSLQADACGPVYKYDSHTRLQLEGKDQMRARGVPSPDEWDAVALTFAEPVSSTPEQLQPQDRVSEVRRGLGKRGAGPRRAGSIGPDDMINRRRHPDASRTYLDRRP